MRLRWRPPLWARTDAAQAAIEEAQQRSEHVERQGKEVRRVTERLSQLGRANHFQESVRAMLGVQR